MKSNAEYLIVLERFFCHFALLADREFTDSDLNLGSPSLPVSIPSELISINLILLILNIYADSKLRKSAH